MNFETIALLFVSGCLGAIVVVALTSNRQTLGGKTNSHNFREWVAATSGWAAMAAGGFAAYYAFGQLGVMKDQLDAMENDQRAWLKIDITPVSLTFDSTAAELSYHVKIENVGHSVAIAGVIYSRAIASFPTTPTVSSMNSDNLMQQAFCDEAIATDARNNIRGQNDGVVLYPGQKYPPDGSAAVERSDFLTVDEISKATKTKSQGSKGNFALRLVGCVSYRLSLKHDLHQTGFDYYVSRVEPKSDLPFLIEVGKDISPPELVFDSSQSARID